MANWSQKKMLMTIAGVTVVVCGASAGGVYYAQGLIDEVGQEVATKVAAIAAADQKINKIPGLEKEVIILRENLGEYVKILPDDKDLNDFVRMLDNFERQSGIRGTGLSKQNTRQKGNGRFTPITYSYEMTATLWQGLKFMNLIENYERFVTITDFSFAQGSKSDQEMVDGEVVHTVRLTMQTFQYNASGKGKDVAIPNYEDRKEELREEIWKRMQLIRLENYEHRGQQGRRDIMVDPRERGGLGTDPNKPSAAEQLEVLERSIGAVQNVREMFDRLSAPETTLFEQYSLKKRVKVELATLVEKLDQEAGMVDYGPLRLRWANEVVAPVEDLQRLVEADPEERTEVDPYLSRPELETLVAMMSEDCGNGQLERARERYESVLDRLGVDEEDPRHELEVQAKAWHVKASTAIDFQGLDLNVQGVVVSGLGNSGVLLNGEVYEEGDYVSDDLLVKLVEEEQVWFVFRGLTLVRTM